MGLIPEINRIILASTSQRRQRAAEYAFPGVPVIFREGGPEAHCSNGRDAVDKSNYTLKNMKRTGEYDPSESVLILSADTRTSISRMHDNGESMVLESHGKPADEEEVRIIFEKMHEASQKVNAHPFYMVESASVSYLVNKNERKFSNRYSVIELDEQAIAFYASPEGFHIYLSAFDAFYTDSVYESEGLSPIHVTNVSGGLSLPVLVQLGAVLRIDSISVEDPQFIDAFKSALYNAAVGLDPEVWGESQETINGWPWLNNVAELVIKH